MKAKVIAALVIGIVVVAAAWWWYQPFRVDVRFAASGIDFARLDHEIGRAHV